MRGRVVHAPGHGRGLGSEIVGGHLDGVVCGGPTAFLLDPADPAPDVVDATAGAGTGEAVVNLLQGGFESLGQSIRDRRFLRAPGLGTAGEEDLAGGRVDTSAELHLRTGTAPAGGRTGGIESALAAADDEGAVPGVAPPCEGALRRGPGIQDPRAPAGVRSPASRVSGVDPSETWPSKTRDLCTKPLPSRTRPSVRSRPSERRSWERPKRALGGRAARPS